MTLPTPDYPDWVRPVQQPVQVTVLARAAALTPGGPTLTFDTSQLTTVDLGVGVAAAAPANNRYGVLLQWLDAAGIVGDEWVSFHSPTTFGHSLSEELYLQLPVRGSQLKINAQGDSLDSVYVDLFGTTRAVAERSFSYEGVAEGRLMFSQPTTIAANSSATFRVRPAFKRFSLYAAWAITSGSVDIRGVVYSGGITTFRHAFYVMNANGLFVPEIPLPLTALEVIVTNNDASSHAGSLNMWDVS